MPRIAAAPRHSVVTYLADHFAGPMFAIEAAERCRAHSDGALAEFLDRFIVELGEDRDVLRRILETLGASPSLTKMVGGWLAEKAVRLKLARFTTLSLFESLETLRLGVQGKRGLWTYLAELSACERRLQRFDLPGLVDRADAQIGELEAFRRDAGLALAREDGIVPITVASLAPRQ